MRPQLCSHFLFSLLHLAASDLNILDIGSSNGLVKIKGIKPTFIQKGTFKVVHLINLQNFQITFLQIDNVAQNLGHENPFQNVLESKISLLKKSLQNLLPKKRAKRSWEALGSGIKWIAGNADAEDLRSIYDKFQAVERNQNSLAESNQIEINTVLQDKINEICHQISTSISSKFNETFTSLEMVNLMFNIDLSSQGKA